MNPSEVAWKGDWSEIPQKECGGRVEVWDQTIGCTECGMNLWFYPCTPEKWVKWFAYPTDDDDDRFEQAMNVFDRLHPFVFDAASDPGDEDRTGEEEWGFGPP